MRPPILWEVVNFVFIEWRRQSRHRLGSVFEQAGDDKDVDLKRDGNTEASRNCRHISALFHIRYEIMSTPLFSAVSENGPVEYHPAFMTTPPLMLPLCYDMVENSLAKWVAIGPVWYSTSKRIGIIERQLDYGILFLYMCLSYELSSLDYSRRNNTLSRTQ